MGAEKVKIETVALLREELGRKMDLLRADLYRQEALLREEFGRQADLLRQKSPFRWDYQVTLLREELGRQVVRLRADFDCQVTLLRERNNKMTSRQQTSREISRGGHHKVVCDGQKHWVVWEDGTRRPDGPCRGEQDSRHHRVQGQ